jgi:uncharacterized membrane protein YkvA (DUF1232 family)
MTDEHDVGASVDFKKPKQRFNSTIIPDLEAIDAPNNDHMRQVEDGFWPKLRRFAGKIPFAEDAAAFYYCATDNRTPVRVRAVMFSALAYFVMPADVIPDVLAVLGYTDDATVFLAAMNLVSSHIKPEHQNAAREALMQSPDDGPSET